MKNTEKLVVFMREKKGEIVKVAGTKFGELHFTEEDAEELLGLSEDTAEEIYVRIKKEVDLFDTDGFSSGTCPFCYIVSDNCNICKYGERHKKCLTFDSDYQKLFAEFMRRNVYFDEILPNDFYKGLIKEIEKQVDM